MSDRPASGISRRALLLSGGIGLGGAALGAAGGWALAQGVPGAPDAAPTTETGAVPSRGRTQAGIARPATPQRNGLVVVADTPEITTAAGVLAMLAALGERIDALTDPAATERIVLPDGPGDLTITIGIGPRLVTAIDASLPGADELPRFASDASLADDMRGGDLLISAYASDAGALHASIADVLAAASGAVRRWTQPCVRGAGEGTIVRNPLGYHDGIIVPHGDDELDENVWIADGPAAGGTIAVIRRLRLDTTGFHALPGERQDAVVGRVRATGDPLSGGGPTAEADLTAKSPDGSYLVPSRSHVRAAHPSFTGSRLMLRRGYAYSNAAGPGEAPDDGLLFMCFQRELDDFVRTQHRLDETDDLMTFATPTASASFLIVPGRTDGALGASLGR
ncbi:Dyp-type peroxidase [Microbacterium sp. Clip185]|uniref:Dyp-type peroxidase n=1 Tax=Microbacterium sp. Clip185 TaxID=3025663 RepID=UPI002366296D|nr:Dyp-type peroxidase [Microbacterium sp. Clip185]WDG18776.1 Dyp-type peroxidase [Microbacterium sp. Clip185]